MSDDLPANRPSPNTTQQRQADVHSHPERMRPATRGLLGVLSFVPLVGIIGSVLIIATRPTDTAATAVPYALIFAYFLLLIYFGAYVMNNRHLAGAGKFTWLMGFLLLGMLMLPLYWYIHIHQTPPSRSPD